MARTGQKLERRGKAGQGLRSRSGSTASDPGPKKLGARGGGVAREASPSGGARAPDSVRSHTSNRQSSSNPPPARQ